MNHLDPSTSDMHEFFYDASLDENPDPALQVYPPVAGDAPDLRVAAFARNHRPPLGYDEAAKELGAYASDREMERDTAHHAAHLAYDAHFGRVTPCLCGICLAPPAERTPQIAQPQPTRLERARARLDKEAAAAAQRLNAEGGCAGSVLGLTTAVFVVLWFGPIVIVWLGNVLLGGAR